jgi:hypothetical protein
VIVCAGEFDAPDLENRDYSRLEVNFFVDKIGDTSRYLRKNIKSGNFEILTRKASMGRYDKAEVVALAGTDAACLTKGIVDSAAKLITVTDVLCNHTSAAKVGCPIKAGIDYTKGV